MSIIASSSSNHSNSSPFLQRIKKNITQKKYQDGVENIQLALQDLSKTSLSDTKALYRMVLDLIPKLDRERFDKLYSSLRLLLTHSPSLSEEQLLLAQACGKKQLKLAPQRNFQLWTLAMSHYAQALNIASRSHPKYLPLLHQEASSILIRVVEGTVKRGVIGESLESAKNRGDTKKYQRILEGIFKLKNYCPEEKHHSLIKELHKQARAVQTSLKENKIKTFGPFASQISQLVDAPFPAQSIPLTEKYRTALHIFRQTFAQSSPKIGDFQNAITRAFHRFFTPLLEDAFAILGQPPCHYDIRAMGSLSRSEMCPYSDLEYFILIEDEKHLPYFQTLNDLLHLQITSLGETASSNIIFTTLGEKNKSGFHLDPPGVTSEFIRTPKKMGEHLRPVDQDRYYAPNSLKNTLLKSISIGASTDTLFKALNEEIIKTLNDKVLRERRAQKLIEKRLQDYPEAWKGGLLFEINLKEQFIQPLYHLLSDLALHFNCREKNTLDILNDLSSKKVFDQDSTHLIKQTLTDLYRLRVRSHLKAGEQKETLKFQTLTQKEQQLLLNVHFLILKPLYAHLKETTKHFRNISLLDLSFKEIEKAIHLPNPKLSKMCQMTKHLEVFVTGLVDLKTFTKFHQGYYDRINREDLRAVYLDALDRLNKKKTLERLALIPSPDGTRQSNLRKEKAFQASLKKLTQQNPTPIKISSPTLGQCYLKEKVGKQIFDSHNNIQKQYKGSLHNVARLKWEGLDFHVKQKPSHPLMEYAIYNLTSRLSGEGTPLTELARLEPPGKKPYPILISETIPGENLKTALSKTTPQLDSKHLTWNLLTTILTRPGDGRTSNYILNQGKLHCIDNDIAFVAPIVKNWGRSTIHFCSVLFCIDPQFKLHPEVVKDFLNLDPQLILTSWVKDLEAKEKEYTTLFTHKERQRLYNEDKDNQFTPTLLFREGEMATLCTQFKTLQQALKKPQTANTLLSHLVNLHKDDFSTSLIGPYIQKAYTFKSGSVETRLKKATGAREDRSKTTPQAMKATLGKIPKHEEIENHKLYTLEKAKQELIAFPMKGQGHLLKDGLEINFSKLPTPNRQRLLFESLSLLTNKKMTNFRIPHCTILTPEKLTPFFHHGLKILDLRGSNLESLSDLPKEAPNIEKLYLSGSPKLRYFEDRGFFSSTSLELLKLQELHIARCDSLTSIRLKSHSLKVLKANKNPNLTTLILDILHLPKLDLENTPHIDAQAIQEALSQQGRVRQFNKGPNDKENQKAIQNFISSSLTQLDLSQGKLTPPGLQVIAEIVKKSRTLIDLKISADATSKEGLAPLIQAIIGSSTLTTLELGRGPLDPQAVPSMIQMIEKNRNLRRLVLSYFPLSEKEVASLMQAATKSKTLVTFDLLGNAIPCGMEKALYKSLQENQKQTKALLQSSSSSSSSASSSSSISTLRSSSLSFPIPPMAFGPKEWERYFGPVGEVPPLPLNIEEILNSPCSIWSGKKVKETHLLTLIPKTVNGKSLTLNALQALIEKPLGGGHATKCRTYIAYVEELGDQGVLYSHWLLMSHDVIPDSRNKKYNDQKSLVKALSQKSQKPYTLPKALEAAVTILMEHARSGKRLYSGSPLTYTRCQEKVNNNKWPAAIGGFAASGLCVPHFGWSDFPFLGVAAAREFH
ncbi:putative nucleotidyltransferase substrate binding domain-containing protein [Candidatus Neptunochlamydia vexilliferae]|uniref:Protein-PII uridylyltransferase N-terminal domain-containing protein n=1 Tax=Candidatus Neptunichlamydia vexilliferae TaxID=1651774 RepID=A0ABS0AX89_9BACT|nr:putative nucleotidyltransferase substrate binding domain-containing protein [Candidatus Neptunochlamydia vexilliferae]MBF5058757.1 hypothetical protein [Candidatus Neptunochlamydia vexilliferae]